MKREISVILTAVLILGTLTPALATEKPVTPAPPSWVPEEEYIRFDGSAAYDTENWTKIQKLRAYSESDQELNEAEQAEMDALWEELDDLHDPGVDFELDLIDALEFGKLERWAPIVFPSGIFYSLERDMGDSSNYAVQLWLLRRQIVLDSDWYSDSRTQERLNKLKEFDQFRISKVFDTPMLSHIPKSYRESYERLEVFLDGKLVHPGEICDVDGNPIEQTQVQVQNNRTMVPVRRLAELLGAVVEWDSAGEKITITRAGDQIVMYLGRTTAYRNGTPLEMDAAPYAQQGRTYIPVRYMAEFFGQNVVWDAPMNKVYITEDKAAVEPSNLEAWAVPMGAMLTYLNHQTGDSSLTHIPPGASAFPDVPYGGVNRPADGQTDAYYPEGTLARLQPGCNYGRQILMDGWGILNREDLIETAAALIEYGNNKTFRADAEQLKGLTGAEYQALLDRCSPEERKMWAYTKTLAGKWGERGILCWELFRVSNLVQWGYVAGYVTYPESLALLEPAANKLCTEFDSWDEAYENYLDGYYWWLRDPEGGADVWSGERGQLYLEMKNDPKLGVLFSNELFETGVIPVPDLAAENVAVGSR